MERKLLHTSDRAEKKYSPEDIVLGLTDISGMSHSKNLIETIKRGEKIDFIVMGVPGGGKSTVVKGIEAIAKSLGKNVEIRAFDTVRSDFLAELRAEGREIIHLGQLTPEEKIRWQKKLLTEFYVSERDISENSIIIYEIPGGFSPDIERGEILIENLQKDPKKVRRTLVIFLQAETQVYERAKKIRQLALDAPDDFELIDTIRKEGILLREQEEQDKNRTELKREFAKAATPAQIDLIKDEFLERVIAHQAVARVDMRYDQLYQTQVHLAVSAIRTVATQSNPEIERNDDEWERIYFWAISAVMYLLGKGYYPADWNVHFIVGLNFYFPKIDYSEST